MTAFKIIIEEDQEKFAKEIRKNLDEGYKMVATNLAIKVLASLSPLEALAKSSTIQSYKEFYAYMEKEIL